MKKLHKNFFEMYKFKSIGLRFLQFLVNGGGLICSFSKLLNSSFKNRKFYLNNNGNHFRDFTYIKDVHFNNSFKLRKPPLFRHEVYNICSNNPVGLI